MSDAPHQRFGFDTEFDATGEVAYAAPRPKRSFTPEEAEQIRQQAYAEGERAAVTSITALEERNREAAERIRALMFVFDDLGKLDPGGVQTLLRTVDKDTLALALKGASDGMREMFFSNMSERASKIMREEMENMGPVRLRDVDQAQMAMVTVAKDLAAKGEIILAGASGDDEFVY